MIGPFRGEYRFLSNFHPAPIVYEAHPYPSVEHAYQAAKTLELARRPEVVGLTAGRAKQWGRTLRVRPDWETVKLEVMRTLVREKFTTVRDLGAALLATGQKELVELNTWGDTFWGVDARTGKGQNHLGRILMAVRAELAVTPHRRGAA